MYDESGHLIGEYDANGGMIQEIVWLEDLPVASIRPASTGSGTEVYYIHPDHLGTPRQITDSTNRIVWRWEDVEPFGANAATEDPDGDGVTFVFNLRFPGQYFDSETGKHYNYYRNYDPGTGRYTTSDPIGLDGGINRYAYVGGNPVSSFDPDGLAGSGGPYHPPEGVKTSCVQSDTCPQIDAKMQQLKRMIDSHQGWDWNNPSPRGGGRHSEEIAGLWGAYAKCQALREKKDCDNCPPKKTFKDWMHSLLFSPAPGPDPYEDLGLSGGKSRGGSSGGGGIPGGAPTPVPAIP